MPASAKVDLIRVRGEALDPLPQMAARIGGDPEAARAALAGFRKGDLISWNRYIGLRRQLGISECLSDETLLMLGSLVVESPVMVRTIRAVGWVVHPRVFMTRGLKIAMRRLLPGLEVETKVEGDTVHTELRLPEGTEPDRTFFVNAAGAMRASTCLVGAGEAELTWQATGQGGHYRARIPRSRTIWDILRRTWAFVMNGRAMLAQLETQQLELEAKNRELESALVTREKLLQTLGHELRTPMNGALHAARALVDPDANQGELCAQLLASTTQLSSMLECIFAFSSLSESEASPQPQLIRVAALTEVLSEEIGPEPRLRWTRASELDWIRLDQSRFVRIAVELLRNALNFGAPEEVDVKLAIHDELHLQVLDRGPGIPAHERTRALEPFGQLGDGEARAVTTGLGLGLAVASRLTAQLGGTLHLGDREGGGLAVDLRLPVEAAVSPAASCRSRRVLVVDDVSLNRRIACRLLAKLGCETEEAEDGEEALQKLSQAEFGLVLMDCEMPKLDGWAATRRLRAQQGREPIVVAATAYASEADRLRSIDAGMDEFLTKPLNAARLAETVRRWLGEQDQT